MKKNLLIIGLSLLTAASASAYDFKADNLYFNYKGDGKSVILTCRDEADPANSYSGNVVIPEVVSDNTGKVYTVTQIGDKAFYSSIFMTNVSLPATLDRIGEEAFFNCSSLLSITIPETEEYIGIGNKAFWSCTAMRSVQLSSKVNGIGDYAFYNCRELSTVVIENKNPQNIGTGKDCLKYFKEGAVLYVPEGSTGYDASPWNGLKVIKMTSAFCSINEEGTPLFYYYYGGEKDVITGLANENLATFYTGDIVIPPYANHNGKSYQVVGIGDFTFTLCTDITSVTIPETVVTIGQYAFHNCKSMTSVDIPNTVVKIGEYAFAYCEALSSVKIPHSLTFINNASFIGCKSLTEVTFPDLVTAIGQLAFMECTSLEDVSFDGPVSDIWQEAFAGCTSFKSMTVCNENANDISVSHSAFVDTPIGEAILYVPQGSQGYKDLEPWKSFKQIVEKGESVIEGVNTDIDNAEAPCYDLTGRRIANPTRGIYICNGRKVIVD